MLVFYSGSGTWFKEQPYSKPDLQISYETWETGLFLLPKRAQTVMKYRGKTYETVLLPCYGHEDGVSHVPVYKEDGVYFLLGDHTEDGVVKTHLFTKDDVIKRNELKDNKQNKTKTSHIAQNELSETERNSLVKLVYGMAKAAYGFDPKETKNSATGTNTGSIFAGLEKIGLPVDVKTIRKYVSEGKEKFD